VLRFSFGISQVRARLLLHLAVTLLTPQLCTLDSVESFLVGAHPLFLTTQARIGSAPSTEYVTSLVHRLSSRFRTRGSSSACFPTVVNHLSYLRAQVYYKDAFGAILVFDLSRPETFTNVIKASTVVFARACIPPLHLLVFLTSMCVLYCTVCDGSGSVKSTTR
jgi:hypothetical protein